jgi:hypothetical protein
MVNKVKNLCYRRISGINGKEVATVVDKKNIDSKQVFTFWILVENNYFFEKHFLEMFLAVFCPGCPCVGIEIDKVRQEDLNEKI